MDWSKIADPLKDQLFALLMERLKELGVDAAAVSAKATEAAALGAKALLRKFSGDESADADLVIVEGVMFGIAANFIAKETDREKWISFASGVFSGLMSALPALLPLLI
jgi:hypothetical protein